MIKLTIIIVIILIACRLIYLLKSEFQLYQFSKRGRHLTAYPNNSSELLKRLRYLNTNKRVKNGVYIIRNRNGGKYYVGQSINIFRRVTQHFTGHGNGDVYADFKYGDTFDVTLILLGDTTYKTLNDLERVYIARYKAYDLGYNKTHGNQ